MYIVDGHCDSLLELYKNNRSFWEHNKAGQHLDWYKLQEGLVLLQFMAIYIEPQYKPFGALCRTLEILDYYYNNIEKNSSGKIVSINCKDDLNNLITKRKQGQQLIGVLLSIEGGEALEGKLSSLRVLYKLGIRSLTLTWNQRNQIADGVWETGTTGGITTFGKKVVEEMNTLGMIIDVSHISEAGYWDVLSMSKMPVIATHSCCRSLHDHRRNLSDEQLCALGKNGGLVGINFYPDFLGESKITINNVIEHIEHASIIAGVNNVGLGSDFDGIDKTPIGLENATKYPVLHEKMLQRGWKEEDVQKIMGGNYIRVLKQILE
ncbi:MAG: dipeptidase [Clostridia bacterium]|nr:dipeptidase [Clostridia bacterium]MDD4047631.1 dipeptidase [Clostridia bacterium]